MTTHGHVDDGGDSAGGCGCGGGLESLPLGPPPGLVDVHVAVHDAGHQHQGAAVDHVADREGAAVKRPEIWLRYTLNLLQFFYATHV